MTPAQTNTNKASGPRKDRQSESGTMTWSTTRIAKRAVYAIMGGSEYEGPKKRGALYLREGAHERCRNHSRPHDVV